MLYLQEDLRRVLPQHVHRLVFHVRNTNTSLGNLGLAYKENNLRGYLYTWVGLTLRFVDFKMDLKIPLSQAICFPLSNYKWTLHRSHIMLAVAWILSILFRGVSRLSCT